MKPERAKRPYNLTVNKVPRMPKLNEREKIGWAQEAVIYAARQVVAYSTPTVFVLALKSRLQELDAKVAAAQEDGRKNNGKYQRQTFLTRRRRGEA